MKITFILPAPCIYATGGAKVVFEYCNHMCSIGNTVNIVFDCNNALKKYRLPEILRRIICRFLVAKSPNWYFLDRNITKFCSFSKKYLDIPDADAVIATAVNTSFSVTMLPYSKGKKFYFIQDFENWAYTDEQVLDTFRSNLQKIVISKWLKRIVDTVSPTESYYIPNGLDFKVFKIENPIENRIGNSIAMLYHTDERKGIIYGMETIKTLKKLYPNLDVKIFGVPKRPKYLPNWIQYTEKATADQLCKIYNSSKVFLSTSIEEGFGLTGAESMACGCALVSSAHNGAFEYAENEVNALIAEIRSSESLVKSVIRLFEDDELRIKIAQKGYEDIQKLKWENSFLKFNEVIKGVVIEKGK